MISSVRSGLEEERDALPGLILATGHEPIRFEDFTAKGVPSREACTRAVEAADAYLLLLGERYGEPLADTGTAPTEEEWTVARRRGIPILAFVKRGAQPERQQAALIARVERYETGLFRKGFDGALDLLPLVVAGLLDVAGNPTPLAFRPLRAALTAPWRQRERPGYWSGAAPTLETHVIPVAPRDALLATALKGLATRLSRVGRDHGLFQEQAAVEVSVRESSAEAVL